MPDPFPAVSTDQVAAFVELARRGSLRDAARESHITEQGLRNRLLALERQLGVELYHKARGRRRRSPLTAQGEAFLPHARAFLERARQMGELFGAVGPREVHVAATEYLILYVLIDAVRRFHAANPGVRVRLSTHSEAEVEALLLRDPDIVEAFLRTEDQFLAIRERFAERERQERLAKQRRPRPKADAVP